MSTVSTARACNDVGIIRKFGREVSALSLLHEQTASKHKTKPDRLDDSRQVDRLVVQLARPDDLLRSDDDDVDERRDTDLGHGSQAWQRPRVGAAGRMRSLVEWEINQQRNDTSKRPRLLD